jgi:hypothetical protein
MEVNKYSGLHGRQEDDGQNKATIKFWLIHPGLLFE